MAGQVGGWSGEIPRRKSHEGVAEAGTLRGSNSPFRTPPLRGRPFSAIPAFASTAIKDDGDTWHVAHRRRKMLVGARLTGAKDEQPSRRRKGQGGKHFENFLLMTIADP